MSATGSPKLHLTDRLFGLRNTDYIERIAQDSRQGFSRLNKHEPLPARDVPHPVPGQRQGGPRKSVRQRPQGRRVAPCRPQHRNPAESVLMRGVWWRKRCWHRTGGKSFRPHWQCRHGLGGLGRPSKRGQGPDSAVAGLSAEEPLSRLTPVTRVLVC